MPFAPSSPVRLYATRKPKNSFKLDPIATMAEAESARTKKLSKLSSGPNTEPAIDYTSTFSANVEQYQQSSWEEITPLAEDLNSGSHLLHHQNMTGPDRPLSMQEALAMSTSSEEPTVQGSTSRTTTPRPSTTCDNNSESEYSVEDDVGPIVGRASSVRVSKPQIVENKPVKISKAHSHQAGHSRSSSRSSLKVERVSDHQLDTLPTMLEEPGQDDSVRTIRFVESTDSEDVQSCEPTLVSDRRTYPLPTADNFGVQHEHPKQRTITYESALPTGSTLRSQRPSIVEPETPSAATTSESRIAPIQRLDRTMSAPLAYPGKGLSRRVTIRPADLITKNHHDRTSFRESIVTTPYPPRLPSEESSVDAGADGAEYQTEGYSSKTTKDKHAMSFPNSPGEKDRFPSPERPESLFIDLSLHNRPDARVTLEIEIADKATFDDEALFQQIRAVYRKQLLNPSRRVFSLVRKVSHVTAAGLSHLTNRHYQPFDSANFLRHVHNPRVGRKRKTWVLWLRNQNSGPTSTSTQPSTPSPRIHHIDNLIRLSTRARSTPHSRNPSQGTKPLDDDKNVNTTATDARDTSKRLSTASDASSFYFAYSPAIPKLPFLSSGHNNDNLQTPVNVNAMGQPISPCRSFFWPSIRSGSGNSAPSSLRKHKNRYIPTDPETPIRLTITFHHSFRLTTIALLTLLNIVLAVLCAVIWVIFGVPGSRPGMDHHGQDLEGDGVGVGTGTVNPDWKLNAQRRVVTGVVIGFVVLVLGCLGEGVVLWMGRLVL